MSAKFSAKQLLEHPLPRIVIRNVDLETGPTLEEEKNYHDVSARERRKRQSSGNSLKTSLTLSCKDFMQASKTTKNQQVYSWLTNPRLQKYVKVHICQFTDKDLLKKYLSEGPAFYSYYKLLLKDNMTEGRRNDQTKKTYSLYDFSRKFLTKQHKSFQDVEGTTVEEAELLTEPFTSPNITPSFLAYAVITYIDIVEISRDKNVHANLESFIPNSHNLFQCSHEIVFNDGRKVSHGLVLINPDKELHIGPHHMMSDGKYMAGPVHGSGAGKLLTHKKVINPKIRDYRDEQINFLDKYSMTELDEFYTTSTPLRTSNLRSNTDLSENNKAYIYDNIVYQQDGTVSIMFSINVLDMLIDNSPYGKAIATMANEGKGNVLEKILSSTVIKNLKLFRQRVNVDETMSNSLGTKSGKLSVYSYDNFDTALNSSEGDKNTGEEVKSIKIPVATYSDSGGDHRIKKFDLALSSGTQGLVHFSFNDVQTKRLNKGQYQYSIFVELEDGFINTLRKRYIDLYKSRQRFLQYYNEARRSAKKKGGFNKRFIRKYFRSRISSRPYVQAISSYVKFIDLFSRNINQIDFYRKYEILTGPSTADLDSMEKFFGKMNYLLGHASEMIGIEKISHLEETMLEGVKPADTTQIFGLSTLNHNVNAKNNTNARHTNYEPRSSIIHEEVLINYADFSSRLPKDYGYNYLFRLGETLAQTSRLRVTFPFFAQRIKEEVGKYFSSTDNGDTELQLTFGSGKNSFTDKISNTSFGYLTPACVKSGPASYISVIDEMPSARRDVHYTRAIAEIMAANELHKSGAPPYTQQQLVMSKKSKNYSSIESGMGSLYSGKSVTFDDGYSLTSQARKIAIENGNTTTTNYSVGDTVSAVTNKLSSGARDLDPDELQKSVMDNIGTRACLRVPTSEKDRGSVVMLHTAQKPLLCGVNKTAVLQTEYLKKKENLPSAIKGAPIQFKALISEGNIGTSNENLNNGKTGVDIGRSKTSIKRYGLYWFHFNNLVQVQYLEGFEMSKNSPAKVALVNQPKWKLLTSEIFSRARSSNRDLLCRLVPYVSRELGIARPQVLEMPIYNDHFILTSNQAATVNQDVSTLERVKSANKSRADSLISDNSFSRQYINYGDHYREYIIPDTKKELDVIMSENARKAVDNMRFGRGLVERIDKKYQPIYDRVLQQGTQKAAGPVEETPTATTTPVIGAGGPQSGPGY